MLGLPVLLAAVLAGVLLSTANAQPANSNGQAGVPSATDQAILDRYEGFTRPARQVMLGAPLDGVLATIAVTEGQSFEAGETLAGMDDAVQVLAVEIARMQSESNAAIDAAQAREDETAVELENQRALAERNSATDLDVRRAEATHAQAVAARVSAEEDKAIAAVQYQLELERLDRYKIAAPFAGQMVVLADNTDVGASLRQADPVMQIVSLDPLEATINLPITLGGELVVGQTYRLAAGAPIQGELTATLTNIDNVLDPASQTVRYTFEIENPNSDLPAGFKFKLASVEPVE